MASTSRIFVYGTLRREGPMHALLGDLRFVGAATFQGRLWDFGAFPGVTGSPSVEDTVKGEVYEIPEGAADETFERLDRYEGNGFDRAVRRVTLSDGERCDASLYLFNGDTAGVRRVESGDYVADLSAGARAAPRD